MSQEAIEVFKDRFGSLRDTEECPVEFANIFPHEIFNFWQEVGFGRRSDGFIWLVNPQEFQWVLEIFDLPEYIPFARNSFDEIYVLDQTGSCYRFSASDAEACKITVDFETTLLTISRASSTDDELFYKRHKEMWDSGKRIEKDQCYCFSPAIPLGGDEETSDIYVGDIRVYFELLSQM
ncbi:DUF1851 domain-containing protein [Deinococcus psychrotolerans]|uniref:DUF1851 domain-containing protein n=1 Tax=Deinococcus psychrotolerans TaxID=2489213 RepID=A0A3G8YFB0_9DEIO|nr:GAD-like domain-containing protein [Deinococcus psychrotolerans]AZI43663.1 DUF1851 domain-containing protein [Deinococcus psychrotolerans]